MKSPRREILAPDAPDDGEGLSPLSYELSPLSTSEMTPPPRCALEEEEEAAQTPRAFLPPRPPGRAGCGGDDRIVGGGVGARAVEQSRGVVADEPPTGTRVCVSVYWKRRAQDALK